VSPEASRIVPSPTAGDIDGEAARFLREHAHYRDDLAWWAELAERAGSPVLDLGAAAGRVSLVLAAGGHRVWALDRSQEMLDQITRAATAEPAVATRVQTVRADMRSFALGMRFPLVIIAMNTFQALLEPDDQLACLTCVRRHLAPDGELAFDVALPDAGEIVETLGRERDCGAFVEPLTGVTLTHSAWYDSWDPITQTLEFTHRIRESGPGGREAEYLRPHRVHLFMPVELEHLLARAGLVTIEALGDFEGGPVTASSQTQIRRCRAVAS
jgi:SAM-dependent methyltransferase